MTYTELDDKTKKVQETDKKNILKVLKCLQKYAQDKGMENNFIIIMASQFNSGFSKPDFTDTNIVIGELDGKNAIAKVGDIVTSLKAKEKKRDNFFYIFYKREDDGTVIIDRQELCEALYEKFVRS